MESPIFAYSLNQEEILVPCYVFSLSKYRYIRSEIKDINLKFY